MANKKNYVSMTQWAKSMKLAASTVSEAIKSGRLSRSVERYSDDHGRIRYRIDSDAAKKEWKDNRNEASAVGGKATKEKYKKEEEPAQNQDEEPTTYSEARTQREHYLAKIAELDYYEKSGKLVDADDVRREAAKIARRVRDSVMGIPGKVSQELVHMNDAHAIEMYIKERLSEALKDLQNAG